MTQKKSTKWCSIILGSYLYYHTTYQERNDGDLGSLKWYHWMQAGQRMHSSGTATQSTVFVVGNKFWCGHNLDHFFPVNNGCFTIFTVFYCFSLKVQESMFTFSHFLHLLFLHCFGIFLQFTFIPNAKIIPGILLSFWNCTAVWIISDRGLQTSLQCVHAFPRFHLEDFSLSASSRVPSGLVRIKRRMGRLGLRLLFIHFTQIAKVWLIQNPAWFTMVAISFLPTSSWALSTILRARFVSLKNRVLKSPLPPPHSNFRHIGFEIHAVYCESLFLIWGLQVTQLFVTASHLRDKWMHCSSADLSGGNI